MSHSSCSARIPSCTSANAPQIRESRRRKSRKKPRSKPTRLRKHSARPSLQYRLTNILYSDLTREVSSISLDKSNSPSPSTGEKRKAEDANASDIISVKIADLGNACWVNHHFTDDIQTRQYRSPEVILGGKWGASTDVWSMAAMVSILSILSSQ